MPVCQPQEDVEKMVEVGDQFLFDTNSFPKCLSKCLLMFSCTKRPVIIATDTDLSVNLSFSLFYSQIPARVFSIVIWLTNKVFTRRQVTSRTQATGHEPTEGT